MAIGSLVDIKSYALWIDATHKLWGNVNNVTLFFYWINKYCGKLLTVLIRSYFRWRLMIKDSDIKSLLIKKYTDSCLSCTNTWKCSMDGCYTKILTESWVMMIFMPYVIHRTHSLHLDSHRELGTHVIK